MTIAARRRFFASEVIQTSSMDCGPAALKSMLDGYSIPISYGRLREACHTDIDGTSIDALETVAREAGLNAEQIMVPRDHVLIGAAHCLPAIAAVRGPSGNTHFVVVWRAHGPIVQIMDPARGRLWVTRSWLREHLVAHAMAVPAADWRAWAASEDFLAPLRVRLNTVGLSRRQRDQQIATATRDIGWTALASLDAATRMIGSLLGAGALSRADAPRALTELLDPAFTTDPAAVIPESYWTVRPHSRDHDSLMLKGAVLARVRGRVVGAPAATLRAASPELAAALEQPPPRPLRDVVRMLRPDGIAGPVITVVALVAAAITVVFEALLLRSVVDVGQMLQGPGQALWAGIVLVVFAAAVLALELVLAGAERRLGSHLEARLRIAFLDKLPRLADAYFLSRPIADMLERSHALHTIRTLPRLATRFLRVGLEMALTALALVWLNPGAAWLALLATAIAALIPLLGQSFVAERDLRARTHAGALAKFHLDALRGRTALEAHSATRAIENEHELLLAEWAASALSLQRASMAIEGLQLAVGFGLAAWMLMTHLGASGTAALLLQAYWMLNLPGLGYELALIAREYPSHRSTMMRLLEPLGAPDHATAQQGKTMSPAGSAVALALNNVSVRAGGNAVLEEMSLRIAAGEHVAIVGASGAGKSTLVGLLLGWSRPAEGLLLVDGAELSVDRLDVLRQATAWVDPTVQLWNASLLDNLLYGTDAHPDMVGGVLEAAGLLSVVARLSDGLATSLGEGGALLSAGEAQRVRFGRALLRQQPRLAILDEPFVGLERDRRRALLAHARQRWQATTLLYVTHDVPETRAFDRVLVIERGRLVEDGDPRQLANMASSRYRRLLQAHDAMQNRLTAPGEWRRIRLEGGRIVHDHARSSEQTA